MNQNDVDRYFWRTGLGWVESERRLGPHHHRSPLGFTILLLGAFAVTAVVSYFAR